MLAEPELGGGVLITEFELGGEEGEEATLVMTELPVSEDGGGNTLVIMELIPEVIESIIPPDDALVTDEGGGVVAVSADVAEVGVSLGDVA